MLLVVDVGNTNTVLGVYRGATLEAHWRLSTQTQRTGDEYAIQLRELFAIKGLPWRERKVIGLYYYGEVTMKHIGAEIGVNESRVSQLHARAIRRLRDALGQMHPQQMAEMRKTLIAFASRKLVMAKAAPPSRREEKLAVPRIVVLAYKPASGRALPVRASIKAIKVTRPRHAVVAAR